MNIVLAGIVFALLCLGCITAIWIAEKSVLWVGYLVIDILYELGI